MSLDTDLQHALSSLVDDQLRTVHSVAGGDIHANYLVTGAKRRYFAKTNSSEHAQVLESEWQSLSRLADTDIGSFYPSVYGYALHGETAVLLIQALELEPITAAHAGGVATALQKHHACYARQFGWPLDNYIGLSAQANAESDSWLEFFAEQRLKPQLQMAQCVGLSSQLVREVSDCQAALVDILGDRTVKPSLVHGDLWGGNLAINTVNGTTAFYDPAPYYGDAEVDIAMSRLFGALPAEVYRQYRRRFPLAVKETRLHAVYNLYHALNHVRLFGLSYEVLVKKLTDLVLV